MTITVTATSSPIPSRRGWESWQGRPILFLNEVGAGRRGWEDEGGHREGQGLWVPQEQGGHSRPRLILFQ